METNEQASRANRKLYDLMQHGEYALVAPHLRHESIRHLYEEQVSKVFDLSGGQQLAPRVLDLGAGDGLATLPFLRLGAHVVAVDISAGQLEQLKLKCSKYADRLELRCEDMAKVLAERKPFDIVVMNSVLHHIPDYMAIVDLAAQTLSERGVFLSFQDPMWKTSITTKDNFLSDAAYVAWRLSRGDVLGGTWRRFRRSLGFYSSDSTHDNAEYHAIRSGVDQRAIQQLFESRGLHCEIIKYCSLHSEMLQPIGERLGIKNTFALVASKNLSL